LRPEISGWRTCGSTPWWTSGCRSFRPECRAGRMQSRIRFPEFCWSSRRPVQEFCLEAKGRLGTEGTAGKSRPGFALKFNMFCNNLISSLKSLLYSWST
jgi:hypothetical protein